MSGIYVYIGVCVESILAGLRGSHQLVVLGLGAFTHSDSLHKPVQHCKHTGPTVLCANSLQMTLADVRRVRIARLSQQQRDLILEFLLE